MGISACDVVPFTHARATLSGLAEQVKAGAEKIITRMARAMWSALQKPAKPHECWLCRACTDGRFP